MKLMMEGNYKVKAVLRLIPEDNYGAPLELDALVASKNYTQHEQSVMSFWRNTPLDNH